MDVHRDSTGLRRPDRPEGADRVQGPQPRRRTRNAVPLATVAWPREPFGDPTGCAPTPPKANQETSGRSTSKACPADLVAAAPDASASVLAYGEWATNRSVSRYQLATGTWATARPGAGIQKRDMTARRLGHQSHGSQ